MPLLASSDLLDPLASLYIIRSSLLCLNACPTVYSTTADIHPNMGEQLCPSPVEAGNPVNATISYPSTQEEVTEGSPGIGNEPNQ